MTQTEQTTFTCPILAVEPVTRDVRRFVVEKPQGFRFEPGQATEVALNRDGWRDKKHPFTFTSLNTDAELEFTVKIYPSDKPGHEGVTETMGELGVGDELLLGEPWGTITYRGRGLFIAGGAGVTPFIAIFRQLEHDQQLAGHTLLLSNKTAEDIILEGEFKRLLGERAVFTLTRQENEAYRHGRIDRALIEEHRGGPDEPVYLCGPPKMVEELGEVVRDLGAKADQVVLEE